MNQGKIASRGVINMIPMKRIAAAFMAVLFCASAVVTAGCGKKVKSTNETVSESDEWYSIQKFKIGEQYVKDKEVEFMNADFVGIYEGKPVYGINGNYMLPDDVDMMNFDYNSLSFNLVDIYGTDGSLEKSIDVNSIITEADLFKVDPDDYKGLKDEYIAQVKSVDSGDGEDGTDEGSGTDLIDDEFFEKTYLNVYWSVSSDYSIVGDKLNVSVYAYYPGKTMMSMGEDKNFNVEIDINSEKVLSCNEKEEDSQGYTMLRYDFEGYKAKIISVYNFEAGTQSYNIDITTPDGESKSYDVNKCIKGDMVDFVYGMMYIGNGKALVGIQNTAFDQKVYEFDLEKGTFTEYQKDVTSLLIDFYQSTYINGVGNIIVEEDGIKKIEPDKGAKTTLCSFDSCNLNHFETMMMSLLTMTDDTIYLGVSAYSSSSSFDYHVSTPTLYILTKEDKNPNAGKTVLRAAVMDSLTYSVSEAVVVFNETNPDYYIRVTDEYSLGSKVRNGEYSWNDSDADIKAAQFTRDLAYQLMSDLKNGDGPDLVFSYGVQTQLNDSEYLIDLKSEIGTEGLFENIVKSSEVGGKIYQYPLSFVIEGIITDKKDVDEDQYGFTFDQYKDFVSGPCNGEDPVKYGQTDYFNLCYQRIEDKCFNGKKLNLGNDDYRMLAEYVSQNVIDKDEETFNYYVQTYKYGQWTPTFDQNITLYRLMSNYADSLDHIRIMGLPTVEGIGPSLSLAASVGVSAHTAEKEACIKFVKTLLSDEVQYSFAEGNTPVNKAAFEATARNAITDYNFVYEKYQSAYGYDFDLSEAGMPWHRIDPSFVDTYEEMIDSCYGINAIDAGIALIFTEEMPAYFAGQKSLDDVIKIIENRSQTMLNERG